MGADRKHEITEAQAVADVRALLDVWSWGWWPRASGQGMACQRADRSPVRRERMRWCSSVAAAGLLGARRM